MLLSLPDTVPKVCLHFDTEKYFERTIYSETITLYVYFMLSFFPFA